MSKKKGEKQLPALRFPEFQKVATWRIRPLRNVCNISCGGTPSRVKNDYWGGNIPWISSKYFGENNQIIGEEYITPIGLKKSSATIAKQNSTMLITRVSVGKYAFARKDYAINQDITCINPNKEVYANFLFYSAHFIAEKIKRNAIGTGIKGVTQGFISSLTINIPEFREQQKIADCLSSLDNVISLQTKKIDVLQQHKKGLMQKLFPAEGATLPELRFAEFQGAPEWEERKLSEVSSSIFDGTHQTPSYKDEGIPFFSVENIVSGKENKFISENDFKISTKKNKPEKGDILLTRIGKIGYTRVVDWDYDFSIYVTLAVIKKSKYFNSFFMHYFMQSSRYQAEIHGKSLLNAVPCKTNMDSLRNTLVLLPKLDEQKRIADNFFVLDELITAQRQKLNNCA
ncbi:restriction endonuclease subunit S [Brenneria salicis]|nr:restriction endonuclease subunit S [Brenneria salicis]